MSMSSLLVRLGETVEVEVEVAVAGAEEDRVITGIAIVVKGMTMTSR